LQISAAAVPLLPGAEALAKQKVFTGAAGAGAKALADRVRIDEEVSEAMRGLLFDAQTSGGLLIAVSAERADELIDRLEQSPNAVGARVGEIEAGPPGSVHVVA
jgi:selenide,water dikinase